MSVPDVTSKRPIVGLGSPRLAQLGLYLAGEAGWLMAWNEELGKWLGPSPGSALLGLGELAGILLLGAIATRLLLSRLGRPRFGPILLALLGVAVSLIVATLDAGPLLSLGSWGSFWAAWDSSPYGLRMVVAALLAVVAWWRGIAAARERISGDVAVEGFRLGVLLLASALVINLLVPAAAQISEDAFITPLLVVLFTGLFGLPLAQILDLSEGRARGAGTSLRINRQWLVMLFVGILGLLVLAYLLALILSFERINALLAPLVGLVDTAFWALVYAILWPVSFVVAGLIYLFRLLLHPSVKPHPFQVPATNFVQQLHSAANNGSAPSAVLMLIAKWGTVAIIGGLVIWLLARAVFRYVERLSPDEVEEEHDFVWSWEWLRSVLARLRSAIFRPRRIGLARGAHPPLPAVSTVQSALGPRELYRELLRVGVRLGRGRLPDETPLEYERVLEGIVTGPDALAAVDVITTTYVEDRYSAEAPPPSRVDAARSALARLAAPERDENY
ncbi:MAG TPA: DUF4129 domain-containing protein [Chloroflexota bacterium]|nr:DUF4129 domain-containing protein [Chloroflexota bacterium]